MGLTDMLKGLRKKTEESVVGHKDQIEQAVGKAGAAADRQTDGKYHEQIQQAEAKVDALIDSLEQADPASGNVSPKPGSPTAP